MTDLELQAIKDVIMSIFIAMKNIGMYGSDHPVCRQSLTNVRKRVDKFIEAYGNLKFFIEKDYFLVRGQMVRPGMPTERSLMSILFRDGIRWIEFQKGIEEAEIVDFFNIIRKYSILHEEAEGDVVTAMWEKNFPHIFYEAKDVFWEAEPIDDFSLLQQDIKEDGQAGGDGDNTNQDTQNLELEKPVAISIASSKIDRNLLKLTPEEMEKLRDMVIKEENRDSPDDILEVLIIILEEQQKAEDFISIMDSLKVEIRDHLEKGDFEAVVKHLKTLRESNKYYVTEKPWSIPLLNDFFSYISSRSVFGVIDTLVPEMEKWDESKIKLFRQVLSFVTPEAIPVLAPLMVNVSSPAIRNILMNVINSLAQKNIRPLEPLLSHPNEELVIQTINIVGHLWGPRPIHLLLNMLRHSSERVRIEALKPLMSQDPHLLKPYFSIIEDKDENVRTMMFNYLRQRRSEIVEAFFLDYFENRRFRLKEDQHIMECFKTLGLIGSAKSIPFLKNLLLGRGRSIIGIDRSIERQGAALSLSMLEIEEAVNVLKKGSRSLSSDIRAACKTVVKKDNI